jgi:hypothetical protein
MDQLTFEHKKAWVIGLLIDCPLGKEFDDCPAKEARKLPVSDRLDIANGMDENQLDQIIDHHRDCLRQREESLYRRNS